LVDRPVNDFVLMSKLDSLSTLKNQLANLRCRKDLFLYIQRPTRYVFDHQKVSLIVMINIVDMNQTWVIQLGNQSGFLDQILPALRITGEIARENLQLDLTSQ